MSNARRAGRTKKRSLKAVLSQKGNKNLEECQTWLLYARASFRASYRRLGIHRLVSVGRITVTRINTCCSEDGSAGCKNISMEISWNREIKGFCRVVLNKSKIFHQPRYLESQGGGDIHPGGKGVPWCWNLDLKYREKLMGEDNALVDQTPQRGETELHMQYFWHELLSGMHCNVTQPRFFLFNVKECTLFPPHSFSGEWEVWEFSSWHDN